MAQAKFEAPPAGLRWYVEAEASPPIVTHSCWILVILMEIICQHSHGNLPLSTRGMLLQMHSAIC
jgi:hypothetical protein